MLLNIFPALEAFKLEGDEQIGVNIILKALEEPTRQIVSNAGYEGSIIVEQLKHKEKGIGFDAEKGEYVDMVKKGFIDPTKVTRSALQNAASIAGMVLTTECLIADKPDDKKEPVMPGGGGMPGGGMGMY